MHTFRPRGVCSKLIEVELDGDIIKEIRFTGGCDGNLKAIAKLVAGQRVDDVVALLRGNTCGSRAARLWRGREFPRKAVKFSKTPRVAVIY